LTVLRLPRIGASRATTEAVRAGIPIGPRGGILAHTYRKDRHSGAGNCVCGRHEGHRLHADAEQAKSTGGMVALLPRLADAENLVVPGGEPLEDLHCTIVYLGEDVRGQDPTELISQLDYVSANFSPIEANIFGIAQFNPDGPEPCMVYIVGGAPDITGLFRELKGFVEDRYPGAHEQHDPFCPHVTAGYNLTPEQVTYTGPVLFDRLTLAWAGDKQDFDL
jgi:hypothetical protein